MQPKLPCLALVLASSLTLACQQPASPAPQEVAPSAPQPTAAAASMGPKETGTWSFDFKDPPPGPRAPTYSAFRLTIGTTGVDEADDMVKALGLECGDTSIRAMMDRRRDKEKKRIEEAKKNGEDAVTAASWVNRRSKREANPQVRFSCPKITSDQIGDRERKPSTGRLLYVFDAYEHPLRHASYQRSHQDPAVALADFNDTIAALTRVYGPPTAPYKGELPAPDKAGVVEIPVTVNYEVAWEYADLEVRTNLLRYGNLYTVGERVEVPHGLRPDAPRVGAGAPTPTPAAKSPPGVAADGKSAGEVDPA